MLGDDMYRPPPEHACDVWKAPIDLGFDEDTGEASVMYVKIHFYNKRTVWFSMQQSLRDASGELHTVCRIDCCDGEIHRHVFKQGRADEIDRKTLVKIPVQGHNLVHSEYERYYADMFGNWEARVRAWRS